MLPPERSASTCPEPPASPPRIAAMLAAPAPSTTSFVRSASRTIASAICSSSTVTMSSSVSPRIRIVTSPGSLTAIPSAIV